MTFQDIIQFWFSELTPAQWFRVDSVLDLIIKERFSSVHKRAAQGELAPWRVKPLGRLAEILILDQFSRNIYRNRAKAYHFDGMALVLAQEAVSHQVDYALTRQQQAFLYMPFMHSESRLIHEQAIDLYSKPGLEDNLDFEYKHKSIIDRFGRYPHRNPLLKRRSTVEELNFLKESGSSF